MKRIMSWLDINFEPIAMATLFYGIILLLSVQVFMRFVFESGFSWVEEVARFAFVWLMYFSISYVTRKQRHIRITYLIGILKEKGQKIVMLVVDALFLIFAIVSMYASFLIIQSVALYGDKAVTISVSLNIVYAAGFIGFVLIAVRVIQGMVWKIKNFAEPMEVFEDFGDKYNKVNTVCFDRTNISLKQDQSEAGEKEW